MMKTDDELLIEIAEQKRRMIANDRYHVEEDDICVIAPLSYDGKKVVFVFSSDGWSPLAILEDVASYTRRYIKIIDCGYADEGMYRLA